MVARRPPARLHRRGRSAASHRGSTTADRLRRIAFVEAPVAGGEADHSDRLAVGRRGSPRPLVTPVRARPRRRCDAAAGDVRRLGSVRDLLAPQRAHDRVRRRSGRRARPPAAAGDLGGRRRRTRAARPVRRLVSCSMRRVAPVRPAYSPDGRWVAAVGLLDPEPLDDRSPELLVGPARHRSGLSVRSLSAALDRPIGNWADTDLNGWMVSGRTGPIWIDATTIVAVVTDRGRSLPCTWVIDGQSGDLVERAPAPGDAVGRCHDPRDRSQRRWTTWSRSARSAAGRWSS